MTDLSHSFFKVIPGDSWDYGADPAETIKLATNGLVGADFYRLVKRAGERVAFEVKLAHDDLQYDAQLYLPLHLIALGATERFGCNRNGDGFKRAMLKRTHDTFVKHARFYRHHRSKNPAISYGQVKRSWYNDAMDRVELLVFLNRNEKAAKLNGNLVADEECEMAESGKSIPVSMSCGIHHDECSVCGNKARTRREYCESKEAGGSCPGFGCVSGLTKLLKNGHIQHVDNIDPDFGDISRVFRGADRIAFGEIADYLRKSAADGQVLGGAELAELLLADKQAGALWSDLEQLPLLAQRQLRAATALAEAEADLPHKSASENWDRALGHPLFRLVSPPPHGPAGPYKLAAVLGALAEARVVLPITDFLESVLGMRGDKLASHATAVPGVLPGLFNRLTASPDLAAELRCNPFSPCEGQAPPKLREWAAKQAALLSLDPDKIRLRASLSAIRNYLPPQLVVAGGVKQASDEVAATARLYGLYKIAFLAAQPGPLTLTAEVLVRQNCCQTSSVAGSA